MFSQGVIVSPSQAQVIEFESNGLTYQTLTRGELTIMYAVLPTHIKNYAIIQVAISPTDPPSVGRSNPRIFRMNERMAK